MGEGRIIVNEVLRWRLTSEPLLRDEIAIKRAKETGDGFWLLTISTPLLPAGDHGMQEIVIDANGKPRFKPARDDDIGAGRGFKTDGEQ